MAEYQPLADIADSNSLNYYPMNRDLELHSLRRNYETGILSESELPHDPFQIFHEWLKEAKEAEMLEPNAMFLATVSADGRPAGRVVLLKQLDHGLVFFTNYSSRKGQHIAANDHVAATFFWDRLERQVRVEGQVEKIGRSETEAYFNSRPLGSRIGAIVSPQSKVIESRQVLEDAFKVEEMKSESDLKCPENWGGYRIIPTYIEFWQGRSSRLHDRIVYEKSDQTDNQWVTYRLAP